MRLVTRLNVVALLCILALIMSLVAAVTPGPQGLQGEPGVQGVLGVPGTAGAAGPSGTTGPPGPVGPRGSAGLDGASGADGTSFTWCGDWAYSATYVVYDVVRRGGSSYVCVLDNKNHKPPNSKYWDLMASAGEAGAIGPAGVITGLDPGSLYVTPYSVEPGGTITVYGVGITYAPTFWLYYIDGSWTQLTAVTSYSRNRYSVAYTIPIGTASGLVEVAVKDAAGTTHTTVPLMIE